MVTDRWVLFYSHYKLQKPHVFYLLPLAFSLFLSDLRQNAKDIRPLFYRSHLFGIVALHAIPTTSICIFNLYVSGISRNRRQSVKFFHQNAKIKDYEGLHFMNFHIATIQWTDIIFVLPSFLWWIIYLT